MQSDRVVRRRAWRALFDRIHRVSKVFHRNAPGGVDFVETVLWRLRQFGQFAQRRRHRKLRSMTNDRLGEELSCAIIGSLLSEITPVTSRSTQRSFLAMLRILLFHPRLR